MDPSPIASTPVFVRRGDDCSRISGLIVDLDQPRSGHDGLFARQLPIASSGLMPADILGFC